MWQYTFIHDKREVIIHNCIKKCHWNTQSWISKSQLSSRAEMADHWLLKLPSKHRERFAQSPLIYCLWSRSGRVHSTGTVNSYTPTLAQSYKKNWSHFRGLSYTWTPELLLNKVWSVSGHVLRNLANLMEALIMNATSRVITCANKLSKWLTPSCMSSMLCYAILQSDMPHESMQLEQPGKWTAACGKAIVCSQPWMQKSGNWDIRIWAV